MLPYTKHEISQDDINAVVKVLESGCLTKGPNVELFEQKICDYTGAKYAVAVSSGTAALHAALHAARVHKETIVNVPTLSFAATANCVTYVGALVNFMDIDPIDLLANTHTAQKQAVTTILTDYAGNVAYHPRIITDPISISDACHSLGGNFAGNKVGTLADITCFSFHPAKAITTGGEGGMLVTNNHIYAKRARTFRDHGIEIDLQTREKLNTPYYDIADIGYNYRMTEMQAALGVSQLKRLDENIEKRRELVTRYNELIYNDRKIYDKDIIVPLKHQKGSACNLYVINWAWMKQYRDMAYMVMRSKGVGVALHYPLIHTMSAYHGNQGVGMCPVAERAIDNLMTLPLFPSMKLEDVDFVVKSLYDVIHCN